VIGSDQVSRPENLSHRPSSQVKGLATWLALALQLGFLSLPLAAAAETPPPASVAAATPAAASNAISLADYRARLQSLDQIVAACQRKTTPANCRSDQVGPDIQIALPAGPRPIRFAWLRALLDQAAKKQAEKENTAKDQLAQPAQPARSGTSPQPDKKQPAITIEEKPEFPTPTLAQRLADARKRLAADAQVATHQANLSNSSSSSPNQPASPSTKSPANTSPERRALTAILAAREYNPAVTGRSLKDRLLEKIANWIDKALDNLAKVGAKSKWIGPTAEIGFCLLLCTALVWFLIRLERQGRFNPAMLATGPGNSAASARDWQLWLEDARQAADLEAWRDAIHLLYWASISRLESSGLWPADRARTPREYLALLSAESGQRPNLVALTRSFERTWYAGRAAAEADFRQAEQLAASLGAGGKSSSRLGAR
jgi:Domain of unknown function (DUF4129)